MVAQESGKAKKNGSVLANQANNVPVKNIIRMYQDGFTVEEIMEEHPKLSQDDIEAALRAKRSMTNE